MKTGGENDHIGGVQRAYYVRPRGVDYGENIDEMVELTLRFRAIDPRKYGEELEFDVDATPADVEYGGNRPTSAYLLTVEGPVTNLVAASRSRPSIASWIVAVGPPKNCR